MKRILVIGSVNLDEVYSVSRIAVPGETVSCSAYNRYLGGKGNNQALALSRAGASVSFAGKIGRDGTEAVDALAALGVDVSRVLDTGSATGRALIQVDARGENCIIVHGGANREITPADVAGMLAGWGPGDSVLFQNEISSLSVAISMAHERGIRVYLNPSPADSSILALPLSLVDCLIVNRIEASLLANLDSFDGAALLAALGRRFPDTELLLTLGSEGAIWNSGSVSSSGAPEIVKTGAARVVAVDTTAAGDTFTGYFIAARLRGASASEALREAACAAGICVTRKGATPSIPVRKEVLAALESGETRPRL